MFLLMHGKMSMELSSENSIDCNGECSKSSESSDNDTNQVMKDESKNDDALSTVLGPVQFPLLHKLGVNTDVNMNQLIQEMLKPHGNQKIHFT